MIKNSNKVDFLIVGAGAIGLSIGISLLEARSNLKVLIVEKENSIAAHASGRNSGVIHAGFYYSPDSLKAKFCRDGNKELKNLCKEFEIPVIETGKVVVSKNDFEDKQLDLLYEKGILNGVDISLLEKMNLPSIEPLAVTHKRFLWSPTTAVVNVNKVNQALLEKFLQLDGQIIFGKKIKLTPHRGEVITSVDGYEAKHIVNAAGAYADVLSKQINVGTEYAMLPFLGLYRVAPNLKIPLKRLVYPVPHPINPFLGIHLTLDSFGNIKIGPTAIPVFGREQYKLISKFSIWELINSFNAAKTIIKNDSHDFSEIIKSEMPNFALNNIVAAASTLVPSIKEIKKWTNKPGGIRSQLVNLHTGELEQDFIVKKVANSTHVLNAVSPGFTSCLPFSKWVAETVLESF